MGLLGKIAVYLVLFFVACGLGCNLYTVLSCEYLEATNPGDLKLGLYKYSLEFTSEDITNNNVTADQRAADTQGECVGLDGAVDLDWHVVMARVCAILAPVCGGILFLWVVITQCWRPIPCTKWLVGFCYFGAQVGTALIWTVGKNELCDEVVGGCEWGTAAIVNLCAQICYLIAAFGQCMLPDPAASQQERRADRAEAELAAEKKKNEDKDKDAATSNADAAASNDADMKSLQQQLEQQTAATTAAEQATTTLQAEYDAQGEELEKQRNALAAATAATGTAAAAEAAKIKELQDKLDKQQKAADEAQQKYNENAKTEHTNLDQANAHLQDLEKEHDKTKVALAAATAAASTAAVAEAAKIKDMQDQLDEKDKELQDALEEADKQTKALAVATAAASTAAVAEAAKIKELNDKLEAQNEALQEALEEADKQTKALAVATAATGTAAVAEGAKIKELQDKLAEHEGKFDEKDKELQDALEECDKQTKALAVATAATTTAAGAEALKILELQDALEKQSQELAETKAAMGNLQIDNDDQSGALAAATAATSTAAAAEAAHIKELNEEIDRLKKLLAQAKSGEDQFEVVHGAAVDAPEGGEDVFEDAASTHDDDEGDEGLEVQLDTQPRGGDDPDGTKAHIMASF